MTSPFVHEKHDIGILRADGTTKVGLMLRRGRNELLNWAVFDEEYLAQQYFSGEPGYGNLPPEKELAIRQDDWRAGLGLEVYDANDPKRYHKSTMDMRFRGMGFAGWKATAVTKVTVPDAIVNSDCEATTGWTDGIGRSNEQAHGGTYSWKVGGGTQAYQDLTTWTNNWRGVTFTFTMWIYQQAASEARIGINDGIGTTYSGYSATIGSWVQVTVSRTLNASATRLRLILDASGVNSNYFDDATKPSYSAVGKVSFMIEFNDNLYAAFGPALAKLSSDGTYFQLVDGFAANITTLEVMRAGGADYLFIAIGLSNAYWYMSTAEVFTESTAAVKNFKYFRLVNAAAPTMWGSDGVNTIRSTVNPLNGGTAWSGQTTVDTAYYEITGLKTDGASLFIMKENRPYYLNSAGAVQSDLAPELETLKKSTDNGKNAQFWQAKLYIPWGEQSLLEYDSGTNTWRSPALQATGAAEYNGQVFAVYGDDQFLYVILDYSTKIEVLSGRLENIDGSIQWVWHCINETTLAGCETAFISSVYQKRFWITSTSASDSLYYIPLPKGYADAANDDNKSFQTATTFETPWLHGNFKSTTKAFPELELVMGHTFNASRYFTVKYKKLGDSSWTTIGNYTGSATSMAQSRYIPVDASSNNPKSTMFKLQFSAVTDDTTITPILNDYHLKGILYPDRRKIIAAKVYCANEIQLKDGTIDKGSYDTITATLEEARDATWPVTIYDIDGTSVSVKFLPLPGNVNWYRVIGNEKERKLELEFNVLMQVVTLS